MKKVTMTPAKAKKADGILATLSDASPDILNASAREP
jgi:hypothetical protein